MEEMEQKLRFLLEADKEKEIFRQTYISNGLRKENDAEHAWHLALMAMVFSAYFPKADSAKVIQMVLIHDLVEVYAGDTYCYDKKANEDKEEREIAAAEKLYGLLPKKDGLRLMDLWKEFEKGESEEAKFAITLDRLQPILLNYYTNGKAWIEHGVYSDQVVGRNSVIIQGPKEIADLFWKIIHSAEEKGYLKVREK